MSVQMAKHRNLETVINQIIKEYADDEPKTLMERMVKLGEEHGELAAALLQRNGLKGAKGKTPSEVEENILEEACDMIIILATILSEYDFVSKDISRMIDIKLEKWRHNIQKHESWKNDMDLL
jgi:NTP pyrophosphatase (non-canonical NTP hydrolase)